MNRKEWPVNSGYFVSVLWKMSDRHKAGDIIWFNSGWLALAREHEFFISWPGEGIERINVKSRGWAEQVPGIFVGTGYLAFFFWTGAGGWNSQWEQMGFELLLSLIIIAKALEYVEQWWRGPSRPFLIMQYGKQWHCLPILLMYNYIKITWTPYHFYNWTLWCNWYEFNHTWLPTQHTWVTRHIPVKHQMIQYLHQLNALLRQKNDLVWVVVDAPGDEHEGEVDGGDGGEVGHPHPHLRSFQVVLVENVSDVNF